MKRVSKKNGRDGSRWIWGAGIGAATVVAMTAGGAAAQGLFDFNPYHYDSNGQYRAWMTVSRVTLMAGATGVGFAIGWLFSPAGKELRAVLMALALIFASLIAAINSGPVGWSAAALLAVIGFAYGVGYYIGQALRGLGTTPTTFGSAQWASVPHLAEQKLLGRNGIRLGTVSYEGNHVPFCYSGDRHLFTYAPTRTGKGVSHIVPNLLSHKGSVLVIDVKGENCLITAKARQDMGQEVMAIDPWDIAATQAGVTPARFNPLDWVHVNDPDAPENAMLLADALVQKHDKGEPFWQEEAKALIQGLILLVAFDATYEDKRNLGTVPDAWTAVGTADAFFEDIDALLSGTANRPEDFQTQAAKQWAALKATNDKILKRLGWIGDQKE
ncbi:hypothetical protein So717_41420 [Roseobacter cerasinus]|uniref:Conjugal transfer protein TraG n=1 Tax=Roseobacter cerasinus TaxID=2602289 RepID=A0A640VWI6_9RHOB|nr:type IV secretory system conjugative DNA transfer family protein [Roseobacter cerasinus]GFE52389.1 hypothetical protein So717_41420 [Roseobacter cerasinus]